MKNKFLLLAGMLYAQLGMYAQDYCNTARYGTTAVFSVAQLELDTLVYGQNTSWQGQPQNLSLIISYPSAAADTATKRPLVVLIHGGGFVSGNYADYTGAAMSLASRGFVAVTVQYRLGWQTSCIPNNSSLPEAVYRANQDARAAIRYCLSNAAFRIDPDYVFIQGSSAGAVTALNMQYADEAFFETFQPGIVSALGPLDASTNNHTGTYRIRGIISGAGGVHDTTQITPANLVPVLMFHGTDDNVIPFTQGFPYGCPFFPAFQGANAIKQRTRNLGGCYEFCYEPGGGHDAYNGQSAFIQMRTAAFMKRVLCQECRQITYEYLTLIEDTVPVTEDTNTVSLQETELFSGLSLYPNPVSAELYIRSGTEGNYTLSIYNMQGVLLFEKRFPQQLNVDFSAFPVGMYSLRIRSGNEQRVFKILKN